MYPVTIGNNIIWDVCELVLMMVLWNAALYTPDEWEPTSIPTFSLSKLFIDFSACDKHN